MPKANKCEQLYTENDTERNKRTSYSLYKISSGTRQVMKAKAKFGFALTSGR